MALGECNRRYTCSGFRNRFSNKELIDNHTFNSVTIIENSQEVIDMVWPYCAKDSRFTLIKEDIETWNIPAGSHWDI